MQPTASFTWSALEYFDSYKRSLNETKTKHIPFHKPTNDHHRQAVAFYEIYRGIDIIFGAEEELSLMLQP